MHVIPITCDGECPEWTMIEMQGELERKGAVDPEQEFPIGQLRVSKTVRLFIYALPDRFHSRPLRLNLRNLMRFRAQMFLSASILFAESRHSGAHNRLPSAGGQNGGSEEALCNPAEADCACGCR